jgi:caa(3)-type oxidase subunit IV
LLLLLGIEVAGSFLPLGRGARPLILLPAVIMVGIVGLQFMDVRSGPTIVRLFAAGAIIWLVILLGLGSLDPLTRIQYPVPAQTAPESY